MSKDNYAQFGFDDLCVCAATLAMFFDQHPVVCVSSTVNSLINVSCRMSHIAKRIIFGSLLYIVGGSRALSQHVRSMAYWKTSAALLIAKCKKLEAIAES